jgi:hypothetical protein
MSPQAKLTILYRDEHLWYDSYLVLSLINIFTADSRLIRPPTHSKCNCIALIEVVNVLLLAYLFSISFLLIYSLTDSFIDSAITISLLLALGHACIHLVHFIFISIFPLTLCL